MDSNITKEIVIASFNEDTSWINNILSGAAVFEYNKNNKHGAIPLPNIGREAHTYLHHIYKRYGHFSDYIFFFQGHPFDHTGECLSLINGNDRIWNSNVQMYFDGYWGYAHNSIGTMWKLDPSLQFNGECLSCRNDGYPHEMGLPIKEIWNQIFETPIPSVLEFIPGCQFHVHRDLIYSRPLSFWEKLYHLSQDVIKFPWIFERIVPYVFNNNFKNNI